MTKILTNDVYERAFELLDKEHQEGASAMVTLLKELNADDYVILAAVGYYSANTIPETQLSKLFPAQTLKIIHGVQQFSQIENQQLDAAKAEQEHHADKLRKMLIAMVDDARVVMLKLIEQLVTLQSLKSAAQEEQLNAATRVQKLYAPLANRLGIGQIKWQLEDWAFRYTKPDEYQKMKKALNMRRADREAYVDEMIDKLKGLMKESGIERYEITGRAKHIYSIYKKIERKRVSFDEIYDAIALRILVKDIEACYQVLSFVHASWEPIAIEFDDYISNPKPNGYRSIHTAVVGPEKRNVEVQIRTFKMHEEAELGVCAHWAYKEGGSATGSGIENKMAWLRQVMEWQQELALDDDKALPENQPSFDDRVYVFTPLGDIIDLAKGATPLDFAYHIHSDIGHRCKGALVNDKMVPLTHTLQTGDRVGIQTKKESLPSRDWLNPDSGYLKTQRARSKVAHFFRQQNFEVHFEQGSQIWEKAARNKELEKNAINKAYAHFNFKKPEGLIAALGAGDINISAIIQYLNSLTKTANTSEPKPLVAKTKQRHENSTSHINILGVDNLLTQIAKCCKPIPGDDILGYITQGRGITIHQKDCHALALSRAKNPERVIQVSWGDTKNSRFVVDIALHAENRNGLLKDITHFLHQEKIDIISAHSQQHRDDNTVVMQLSIEIQALDGLSKILQKLGAINGVISINRL